MKQFSTRTIILIVIAVISLGAVLYRGARLQQSALDADIPSPEFPPSPTFEEFNSQIRLLALEPMNGSNMAGVAAITREDGATSVDIEFSIPDSTNRESISMAAHIHEGTCGALGSVVYNLENVIGGLSHTILSVLFDEVVGSPPRIVVVHAGPSLPSPSVACGEIVEAAPMVEIGAEDEMLTVPEGGSGTTSGSQSSNTAEDSAVEARSFKEFDISGRNFEFSQGEIRVKKEDFVRINFTSAGGFHDWTIDEFNAHTEQVASGNRSSVDFIADKAGTFEYYCNVGNHRAMGMVGKLIVEE